MNIDEIIDTSIAEAMCANKTVSQARKTNVKNIKLTILEAIEKLPDVEIAVQDKNGRVICKSMNDIKGLLGEK